MNEARTVGTTLTCGLGASSSGGTVLTVWPKLHENNTWQRDSQAGVTSGKNYAKGAMVDANQQLKLTK
jgi:hypothetical protein